MIDDDALQLRVREAVLHDAGFSVMMATTADSALALLRASDPGKFGAVITDHMLPGISGVELVREIRDFNPGLPIIVVTGMPEAESEYEGLNIHFRQKPCPPEELIGLVRIVTQRTD